MTEPLRFSLDVECPVEHAFRVWTDRIDLWWPASEIKQSIKGDAPGLALDQKVRIEEGNDTVTPVPMKKFDLSPEGKAAPEHKHH